MHLLKNIGKVYGIVILRMGGFQNDRGIDG